METMLRMKEIPAETVANNIDLLTEILLRLPTKPVVTFKCVSKQWLSLISNPKFTVSHTRHHHTLNPTPTALLIKTPELLLLPLKHQHHTVCKVPFLDNLNVPFIRIQQSCNGLLIGKFPVFSDDDRGIKYFICNPTTKQVKQLSFPSHEFEKSMIALSLAFDPLKSIHYKLISIRRVDMKTRSLQIDMYLSETDSWSLLGITFNDPGDMVFEDAVFCNGAIHWYSRGVNSLYFDVDNEFLKTMPMPKLREDLNDHRGRRYFGESCGHLHLAVAVTYKKDNVKFDVLEMAADYSQWFVKYHVDLDAVRIANAMPELIWYHEERYYLYSILGVIRAEKEEESMVVLYVDGRAFSYNPYNGTTKKLCDLETKPKVWDLGFYCDQLFETLCCV